MNNVLHRVMHSKGAARFVSDLVGNPDDRFSHDMAQVFIDKMNLSYSLNMLH